MDGLKYHKEEIPMYMKAYMNCLLQSCHDFLYARFLQDIVN